VSTVTWLAKDLVIVIIETDGDRVHTINAVERWLDEELDSGRVGLKVGALQQGFILDIRSTQSTYFSIGVHGYNGQLPNMDLIVLARRNIELFSPLPVQLDVGGAIESSYLASGKKQSQTRLVQSSILAALGMPTGAHAALLHRNVDAITLTLNQESDSESFDASHFTTASMESTARSALTVTEMIIRTCNNLHEKLHHSTVLYVMLDAEFFVPIGAFMVPPALLLIGLLGIVVVDSCEVDDENKRKNISKNKNTKKLPVLRDPWLAAVSLHTMLICATVVLLNRNTNKDDAH
jgi:hypothetical protein